MMTDRRGRRSWSRITAGAGLALAVTFLADGGSAGASGLAGAPRAAHITIVAAATGAAGGFNYNGYSQGVNWQVSVTFRNAGDAPHSLAVLPFSAAQPTLMPPAPAFSGAATSNLTTGLSPHAQTSFSFVASKAGAYEFICGVPGHAVAGMWDRLVVSPSATAPSVTPATAGAATSLRVQ